MFATGADRPSEPASRGTGRPIPTIVRGVLARRKSLSAVLYTISTGLIAIWIIGVFFGLGFFLLIHQPRLSVSGSGATDQAAPSSQGDHSVENGTGRGTDLPMRLDQPVPRASVKAPQSSAKEVHSGVGGSDPSGKAQQNQNAIPVDRPGVMSAGRGTEQPGIERDNGVPSVDVGMTFGSLGEVAPGPLLGSQSSGAIEQQRAPAHPADSHKRHRRQPSVARTTQRHPPVRAIQDVLQKHSRLLK